MKILYINNDGAGFADYIEVEPGLTVGDFFTSRVKGRPADFLIRVNRQPVAQDYVLQESDRISITPTKIEGARLSPTFAFSKGNAIEYLQPSIT